MTTGFETAVEQHQRRIFSFAYYLLHSREEAEDVTQEVLLRLFRHRRTVEPERMGAWLLRVTRNACYDLLRQRRSHNRHTAEIDEETAHELPDEDTPSPEAQAGNAAFRRNLQEGLRRVPEPYRSVLILREIQGLKYKEIAETLEMPINTVRVHLHRGRRKLRDLLHEDYANATIQ